MLKEFIDTYYPPIAEIIEQQQIEYGLARIHSHRHISRCIIYSNWYSDLMNLDDTQKMQLYFAIAFHDIGRKGELEDVWEGKSKEIYLLYMKENKLDKYIVNEEKILNDIIHDVDCLDIMRSGTGRGGIMGFDRNYLNLLKDELNLQGVIISNAWRLITLTDSIENDTMDCLFNIFSKNKSEWKIGI